MTGLFLRAVALIPVAEVVWAALVAGYTAILAHLVVEAIRDRRR